MLGRLIPTARVRFRIDAETVMHKETVEKVLNAHCGGHAHSLRVLFTAEHVMVVTGSGTRQFVECITNHYQQLWGKEGVRSAKLEARLDAHVVMGLDVNLASLESRLDEATSEAVGAD
ncbi:hypothetical protein BH10PSE18_BH10PSE18_08250 [soil metagenome]